jgi:hypothetical protein
MLKRYSNYRDGEDGTLYNYDYWLKNAWETLERSPKISQEDKERVRARLLGWLEIPWDLHGCMCSPDF